MKKVLLKIDGMTCSACSTGLEKYLNKQDGVKATVNLVMNNASIEYDEKKYQIADLEKFVAKAGFERRVWRDLRLSAPVCKGIPGKALLS